MSEDGEKAAEAAPKKSKAGLVIGLVIAVITLVGGSVAGAVLGPRLLGGGDEHSGPAKGADAPHAPKAPEKIVSVELPPIIVDLRDTDGRLRHLKVGLSTELSEGTKPEEFKLLIPRGREACLTYLRSLSFEEVSDPERYATIKDEISKRVSEAVGAEHVQRLLLIEFVLQ